MPSNTRNPEVPVRALARPVRPLAILAVLVAIVVAGCGTSKPTPPHRPHSNLESIFEDEGLLRTDPVRAMAVFRALGVDRVRMFIGWNTIAPAPDSAVPPAFDAADPAAYPAAVWTLDDEIIRAAAAAHMGLDVTVGAPPPRWAAGPGAPHPSHYPTQWMPSAHDFGEFMRALGTRYSGHYAPPGATTPLPRVDFWSIWNEPNYGPYLAPQAIDHSTVEVAPRLYRGLLDAAWSALLATGHAPPRDTILIGETAPRGLTGPNLPGDFSGTVPLRFIRALYCVGASLRPLRGAAAVKRGCPATAAGSSRFATDNPGLFRASGFADHPYPDLLPPTVRTPPPVGGGYADFAALGDLERTLDGVAAAYGEHVQLPIYSTEFGYRTNPPSQNGLPLAQAALYLNEAEYLSWRNPRIRSYDQYLLTDPGPGNDFVTGLEFANGTPKPDVYDAYRMPLYLPVTHASAGASLEVWGCARPAPAVERATGRPQRVAIEFAARGTARFRTVRTVTLSDPHGYFDVAVSFPGSGRVRLVWSGAGGRVTSRTQSITLG